METAQTKIPSYFEKLVLLAKIKAHPKDYYPLIDHAWRQVEAESDRNLGWNVGLLEGRRPWFCECWADDGTTVLTYHLSTRGLENKRKEELARILEDARIVRRLEPVQEPAVFLFKDGTGNTFFSIHITVADEKRIYISEKGGIVYSYSCLNQYNTVR